MHSSSQRQGSPQAARRGIQRENDTAITEETVRIREQHNTTSAGNGSPAAVHVHDRPSMETTLTDVTNMEIRAGRWTAGLTQDS